jgi:hypothetical protein
LENDLAEAERFISKFKKYFWVEDDEGQINIILNNFKESIDQFH